MKIRTLMRLLFGLLLLLHGPAALAAALCSSVWSPGEQGDGLNTVPLSALDLPTFKGGLVLTAQDPRTVEAGATHWNGGLASNNWKLIAPSSGTAQVFVKGDLRLGNNAKLNENGNPENLVLIIDGDLIIESNNVVIRGFVYATGTIQFKNKATLRGGLSANGNVTGKNNTDAEFDGEALAKTDFAGICRQENVSYWPFDEMDWASVSPVSRGSVTLRGNAIGANTAGAAPALPMDGSGFGTCRYGEFTGSNSYVQFQDHKQLDFDRQLSGSFWLRPDAAPSRNVTLLAKGDNYRLELRPDLKLVLKARFKHSILSDEALEVISKSSLTLGEWSHVGFVLGLKAEFLQRDHIEGLIYLNGRMDESGKTSVRYLGATAQNNEPLQIGGNGSFGLLGAMDEVRIGQESWTSGEFAVQRAARHWCGHDKPVLHHYELNYASSALTCQAHKVTITACANADCSLRYTEGPSRLSLTPSGWDSAVFNFRGSTTGHLAVRQEGDVTLGVTGIPEPMAQQPLKCLVDGVPSANCALRFKRSGFLVEVPDFVAGQGVTASIQAVEADVDNPAVCSPAFDSGTRTVGLSFNYVDPKVSEDQGRQLLTVASTTLSHAPNHLDLTFSVKDGRAATAELESLGYLDVGRLQLNVSYSGTGTEEGLHLSGSTDFVVRPARLSLVASDASACDPERDFSTTNCAKYKAADESFDLTVKALNELGNEVKNFRHSNVALEVVAEGENDRFYPREGKAPEIMPSTYVHELSQPSVLARINEVGIVKIRATAADYLDSGSDIIGVSDFIGRFKPDRFAIELEKYEPLCNAGAFSYAGLNLDTPGIGKQGQPFILEAKVMALSALGTVTENYDASLEEGRFSPLEGEALDVQGVVKEAEGMWGDAVDGYPVAGNALSFVKGVAAVAFEKPTYFFKKVRGPYDVSLVLTATDNEDQVSGSSAPTEPLEFRLGQAHIGNAHGSEMQDLLLPFSVRYFDGEQYIPNLLDNCTLFTPASLGEFKRTGSGSGEPDLIYLNANGVADSPFVVSAGRSGLGGYLLSAPKSSGSVLVTYEDVPDWLKYDWDGDGSVEPPSGLATFGIYKGPKPLIFRREVYR